MYLYSPKLIHPPQPFPFFQEFLKQRDAIRFHFSGVHQLLVVLPPVMHQALHGVMFRRTPVVRLHKVHNLPISGNPQLIVRHCLYPSDSTSHPPGVASIARIHLARCASSRRDDGTTDTASSPRRRCTPADVS